MSRRKKIFEVRYDGLWLGGKAIVKAVDEQDAIEKVANDAYTVEFENVRVTEVKGDVLYNDNGDY